MVQPRAGVDATFISPWRLSVEGDRTGEFRVSQRLFAFCGEDGAKAVSILNMDFTGSITVMLISGDRLTNQLDKITYQREEELVNELVWEGEGEPPDYFRGILWVDTTVETTTTTTTTTEPFISTTTSTTTTTTTTTVGYSLILTFDDLPLVDDSVVGNVITNNNITITPTNAKWDDAGRFDSAFSAYLSMPTGAHFDWGNNPWTVHWWMHVTSVPSDAGIWSNGLENTLTEGINCCFGTGGSSTLRMYLGSSGYIIQTVDGFAGGPNHVAVVNDGSFIRVYKNGVEVIYGLGPHDSSLMTIVTPTTDFVVGRFYSQLVGFNMNTTVDQFVVANEALWTGPFTPPNSPT